VSSARRSWARDPVAMGTNTDPYQRAEGQVCADARGDRRPRPLGTPFSLLTKGTLLRRDLPLLASVAATYRSASASPSRSATRRCTSCWSRAPPRLARGSTWCARSARRACPAG
jgi:hypothetical protein